MYNLCYGGGSKDGGLRGGVDGGSAGDGARRRLRRRAHHLVQQCDRAISANKHYLIINK